MKTAAEKIAGMLGNDGQNFKMEDGTKLGALCDDHDATVMWRDGYRMGNVVRYKFPDGSTITEAGGAWDIGYPDCFCWRGGGHTGDCTAAQPTRSTI